MQNSETRKTDAVTETPPRSIRIDPRVWNDASTTAAAEREKLPQLIATFLMAYTANPRATVAALANIRAGG